MTPAFHDLHDWLAAAAPAAELRARRASGWLATHLPEVAALYGVPQVVQHHPEIDTGVHTELALGVAARLTPDPRVRYAALVHDLGKGLTPPGEWPRHHDHENRGVRPVLQVGRRFGVPADWRRLGVVTARFHLHAHRAVDLPARSLVRLFRDAGFFEHAGLFEPFVLACEADARGRAGREAREYPSGGRLRAAFAIAQAVPVELAPDRTHQERVRAVARAGL